MHLLYILVAFLLCFFGALSNVGGFVFLKIYFQQSPLYTTLEIDALITACMFLATLYNLLIFKKSKNKELTNRTELVTSLCIGSSVGAIFGTLSYFYIYYHYGETMLHALQNIIIFTLVLNSLLYVAFSSFIQTLDIRTHFPCFICGIIVGFLSSLSNVGLLFFIILLSLFMFNTSYKASYNISAFVLFFSLTPKIILSSLISPTDLSTIPYFTEVLIVSFLAQRLGTYFMQQFSNSTKIYLYCSFLTLLLILSVIKFF